MHLGSKYDTHVIAYAFKDFFFSILQHGKMTISYNCLEWGEYCK